MSVLEDYKNNDTVGNLKNSYPHVCFPYFSSGFVSCKTSKIWNLIGIRDIYLLDDFTGLKFSHSPAF